MKKIHHLPEKAISIYLYTLITLYLCVGILSAEAQALSNNGSSEETIVSDKPVTTSTTSIKKNQKYVVITGVRFAYPLVQKWIDDYNKENPDVQIIIESRGSADPAKYDILIEAYDKDVELLQGREYVYIARYAVLPVANDKSEFAKTYADKGLNRELINQLYFHDIFADKEKQKEIKTPYTIYTRLQKAGAPVTFAKYFGHEHKEIVGKSIAGSDEHLLKAVLRDSTSVSYLPLTLAYDHASKKPVEGLSILPVDLNGNGKVNDDEKFYGDLNSVIQQLEDKPLKEINNIPVEYIHMSVDRTNGSPEAISFLRWIIQNGQDDLHEFGYLKPEANRFEADKFLQFASKRLK
jgi:phosphate transport system substrate-binding protein